MTTYNGIRSNLATGSGSSIATSASITVAVGDCVHVGVKYEGGTTTCTVADGLGNTYNQLDKTNHSGGEPELAVFECIVTTGGTCTPTATLGAARTYRTIMAHFFSPTAGTSFSSDSPGFKNAQGTSSTPSTGSYSPTDAGPASCFVATYVAAGGTQGSGWTETYDADTGYGEYRILTGAGSITGNCTMDSADRWVATAINTIEVAGSGTNYTRTLDELLSVSDQLLPAAEFHRLLSEQITVDDEPAVYKSFILVLEDGLDIAEAVDLGALRGVTITDSLDVIETLSPTREFSRDLIEYLDSIDSLDVSRWFVRDLIEYLDIYDDVIIVRSGSINYTIVLDETIDVADELQKAVEYIRGFDESAPIYVDAIIGATRGVTVDDAINVVDDMAQQLIFTRQLDEPLTVADEIIAYRAFVRTLSETLDVIDSLTISTSASVSFTYDVRVRLGMDQSIITGIEQPISLGVTF